MTTQTQVSFITLSHEERYHTKAIGSSYVLPADDTEKDRLNTQHRVLRNVFGGKLILAPVTFKSGDEMLECGVGAADWIMDVVQSKTIPQDVSIHGIDIESSNFPPPTSLPKNVTLSVNSVLNLPSSWSNKFTYIYQHFLVAGLRRSEWPICINQLYTALKPGDGWVELHEPVAVHEGPKEYHSLLAHQLKFRVLERRDIDKDIGEKLPELLKQAGFVDIKYEKRMYPVGEWAGEDGRLAAKNNFEVFKGFRKAAIEGHVATGEEFDKALEGLWEWWMSKGKDTYMGVHVTVGRKPKVVEEQGKL